MVGDSEVDGPEIDDLTHLESELRAGVRGLFPELSEAGVAEIAGTLSLEDLVALLKSLRAQGTTVHVSTSSVQVVRL